MATLRMRHVEDLPADGQAVQNVHIYDLPSGGSATVALANECKAKLNALLASARTAVQLAS